MKLSWWDEFSPWQRRVWSDGGKLMTGSVIVAFVLAVGGTIWQPIACFAAFFAVLFFCMLMSSFNVWRQAQREHREELERLANQHQQEKGQAILNGRTIEGRLVRELEGLYATLRQHNITPPPRPS
jgi:hypothetical protein